MKAKSLHLKSTWITRMLVLPVLFISVIGLLWNSRYLKTHEGVTLDPYLEAGLPRLPRTQDFWEKQESNCFHVDSVCSRNGRWFYGPTSASGWPEDARQPSIALRVDPKELKGSHGDGTQKEEGIYFNVSSTSHRLYDGTCSYSPTPHHMVVQSAWSEMMGEFYSRAILGLNQWMRDFPPRSNDDVQMYIHQVDQRKQTIFEGHQLFLGGLPNNNKFNSFLSMMPGDSCRCYTKLIFCGYKVENATAKSVFTEKMNTEIDINNGNISVLTPGASIHNPKTACAGKTDPQSLRNDNCIGYRKLRRDLVSMYAEKDPMLNQKIRQHQRQILIEKGFITNNSTIDVNEWKFVGLAHRKYRRKWLNIDDAISMCDENFRSHKIVCIPVDVEEADSPEEQLLMHRSLHAFIGVHGAQLTQGVLLPKHGFILELLPWVPFYLWGGWVTTMHRPTPLGIIFHKTDLNHVGYPLDRDSVPLCLHVNSSDEELTRDCMMNKTNGVIEKFRWADRDFNVNLKVIRDFISIFLLKENSSIICDDMEKHAELKNFVMYNAFCKKDMNQTGFSVEHYYRERDTSQPANIHEGR